MYRIIVFSILLRSSMAVIYSLNETEYSKMPSLYALDDYSSCLEEPDGTYCIVDFALYGEGPLMQMIQEYSEYRMKHFNHTQIHRGICVTTTCKRFIKHHSIHDKVGLKRTLEACQNHTMWTNYKLNAKLENIQYCKRGDDKLKLDSYDLAVGIVYLIIIMLSALGTFYDSYQKNEKSGNQYLLAFSLRRNWKKLVAPSGTNPDPRLERLKLFHGMRTITLFCVIFSHTVLIMAYGYVENPLFIEKAYEDPMKQILFNGNLVVHTFFVISSFLLAFNLQIQEEKQRIGLIHWPKGVLLRWLRLSPAYALVLATICTWMRHLGSGPLWDWVVVTETTACRQYWWAHLLFINNYLYNDAYCAPQTWYLAADTQLFCFGLLVCVLFKTPRARVAALSTLLAAALAIVAMQTYFQGLDAVVIQKPEAYRNLYAEDSTFRELYIRGHTNLSAYVLGLAAGFISYYGLNQRGIFTKYRNYRWVMWVAFPLGVATILTGGFFYVDGSEPSTALKVLYATLYKPVFQTIVLIIIMGCIFKLDTVYRGVAEWRGWTWAGRVSYGAFLLHTLFQRGLVGGLPRPTYMTDYSVMIVLLATIFLSFSGAAVMFLLVEAPVAGVVKAALGGKPRPTLRDRDGLTAMGH